MARPVGSKSKPKAIARMVKEYKIEPWQYMMDVLNAKDTPMDKEPTTEQLLLRVKTNARKDDMAKSLLPYCKPRLAQIAVDLDAKIQVSEIVNTIVDPESSNS